MAAGGSSINVSDEYFDNFCSPCNKNSKNTEAVKFCADCQEYLCTTCVADHNKFAALAQHTLLERSQFGKGGGADVGNLPSVPTERCKVHRMKLVDMYCADHDSVGCHICFTITHRLCQDIHYIPEYIQATPQAEYVRRINDELKVAVSRLQNLMKEKQKAKENNNRNKDACLEEIKAYRIEINHLLDRLEKASITEVDEKYNKLDNAFQEELKDIKKALDRLRKSKTEMESSKKNVSQQFVSTKLCEKNISDTEKYKTDSADMHRGLTFARNPEILAALQNLDSLGQCQGQRKLSLYTVKVKDTYSVKLKYNSQDCYIWSSCIFDTGDILLADSINKNIKLVECNTYTVRHSMEMSHIPQSLCRVNATEAAVTLDNKTVQFVSTNDQLVPTRSLKFDHGCRGIAVIDGRLVVCEDGRKAYIYSMNGDRLKTIEKDKSGNDIFGHIREISVSDNGKMIHVADINKGLVTIDKDGNVIWRYSGSELKNTWGVCTDGNGNVFVSGNGSDNVVQIRSDGKYMGEVIPVSYAIKNLRAVSFDWKNSKLIVATANKLHVFLVQ